MDPRTGDIHHGTAEQLQEIEHAIGRERAARRERDEMIDDGMARLDDAPATQPFIPLTDRQATAMKAKTPGERRAVANRVIKRRNKRRAQKEARKKART